MKTVAASRARQEFFKLLDRAVRGDEVIIDRNGIPLRLTRISRRGKVHPKGHPDYRRLLKSPVDEADQWSWSWNPQAGLHPASRGH